MNLNQREIATVLAALRFFQANFYDTQQMKEEMPFHFQSDQPLQPLDHEEIDNLCKQINCGLIKNG